MEIGVLTKSNPLQAWVPFGDDCEILIEYVPRSDLQVIYRKATKTIYKNHQKTEEYDQTEGDKLLSRRAVKDWRASQGGKGFVNDGQPFPFTPENVEILMTKWNEFARFVNDACCSLETLVQQGKEAVEKNSSITSGQS